VVVKNRVVVVGMRCGGSKIRSNVVGNGAKASPGMVGQGVENCAGNAQRRYLNVFEPHPTNVQSGTSTATRINAYHDKRTPLTQPSDNQQARQHGVVVANVGTWVCRGNKRAEGTRVQNQATNARV